MDGFTAHQATVAVKGFVSAEVLRLSVISRISPHMQNLIYKSYIFMLMTEKNRNQL